MENSQYVRVWDPLIRLFHWTLVAAFCLAWLSEDDFINLHVWAGYTILGLLLVRLAWGLVGSRYARFNDFVRAPSTIIAYLKDVTGFRARRYLGHNPAGGAMIVALLITLLASTLSGLAVYGAGEFSGPFAAVFVNAPHFWAELFEEVHEFFVNATLMLVALHLFGVLLSSFQHRENLVRSMVHGMKRRGE